MPGATINSQLDQKEIEFGHYIKVSRMLCVVSGIIWDRNLECGSTDAYLIFLGLMESQMKKYYEELDKTEKWWQSSK